MLYKNVFLSIGTNIGDKLANITKAKSLLKEKIDIIKESSIYETEPWGYKNQPYFYNQVLKINTTLNPHELLCFCKNIEYEFGRKKTKRWTARIIDIDILLFGDIFINERELVIPHNNIKERLFELIPLAEMEEGLEILGSEINDLRKRCKDTCSINKIG